MIIKSMFNTLHNRTPKLAQYLSFITASLVILCNSTLVFIPLLISGAVKVLTKHRLADHCVIQIADYWIRTNNALIDNVLQRKNWCINLPEDINPNKKYLLVCNHQSWVDTSVIQYISQDRLPLTRFFAKFELIYIPCVGQAFYFLDFPMMKRHSKQAIAQNPALKGQDLIEAERACRSLKGKPFTLLNYLEGTRITSAKHKYQNSPYQYLLKPKAGGLALAINALGHEIDGILDMTIVYPEGIPTYSDLWKGNIKQLGVDIRHLDMPVDLFSAIKSGNYDTNENIKTELFDWIDVVWQQKDILIEKIKKDFAEPLKDKI